MNALDIKKPRESCSSNGAVRNSGRESDESKATSFIDIVKRYGSVPEAVISPEGRAVALQRDIAKAFGCADSSIMHICKHQNIRKFAGKFLDLEDISKAFESRRGVGRPRKEALA